jgi:polysaccharide deacetylase 2 family uncharacterized protein YibQ
LPAARALLAVEAPVSLAILPHTPYQTQIAQAARRRGREVLLHLPMEPHNYPQMDPGKFSLLRTMSPLQLTAQVTKALAAVPAVIGVNNHMGSRLTEDREAMQAIMQFLKQHNLFFLDSRTSQKSLAYQVAREFGVPAAQRHVFLDNETNPSKIHQQLRHLVTLAQESGSSIGIGHPYPATIRALQDVLPVWWQADIDVVPISRLVK